MNPDNDTESKCWPCHKQLTCWSKISFPMGNSLQKEKKIPFNWQFLCLQFSERKRRKIVTYVITDWVDASHNLQVLSPDAESTFVPSGLHAT